MFQTQMDRLTMDQQHSPRFAFRHVEVALASPLSPSAQAAFKTELRHWIDSFSRSSHCNFSLGTNGEIDTTLWNRSGIPHADRVVRVRIVDDALDIGSTSAPSFPAGCSFAFHLFELSREEISVEEIEPSGGGEEWTAGCDSLSLPHVSLDGLWENLIFESKVKLQLLEYAQSAMLFSDKKVSEHIVHWNRILLLHGVPGTGKTSLCRALAHKLAIRLSHRFQRATLLEIHSHSLFSKWFSTSGKLVSALFSMVRDMVEDDPHSLVCVLIDEVESLASSRSNAGGGDPSDGMRAVNSLLTSLDRLRSFPNVLVLATTNITGRIDDAFVDRVDLKLEIGLPILRARYAILRTCLEELIRVGILGRSKEPMATTEQRFTDFANLTNENSDMGKDSVLLLECAKQAEGLSGRSLRRLPLQAHSKCAALGMFQDNQVSVPLFLKALSLAIETEQSARLNL